MDVRLTNLTATFATCNAPGYHYCKFIWPVVNLKITSVKGIINSTEWLIISTITVNPLNFLLK